MDAVSHYLSQILTPRLLSYGVSRQFLLYTVNVIQTQMLSLLRHWDDRAFRNTVLLIGLEEGSFYEPPAKLDVRCFVVVTIRNSPIESIQSKAFAEAGLKEDLSSKEVKEITSEAIRYFSSQNFDEMCRQAKVSQNRDLYQELAVEYPVAWAALQCAAGMRGKTVDYPPVPVDGPYHIDGIDSDSEADERSPAPVVVYYDGYARAIEPPLMKTLKIVSSDKKGSFIVDSFKFVTRNVEKLLVILEFLLTRGLTFVSANYYLENGHVERRMKPLRASHGNDGVKQNISNTTGLGYKHRLILSQYIKQL